MVRAPQVQEYPLGHDSDAVGMQVCGVLAPATLGGLVRAGVRARREARRHLLALACLATLLLAVDLDALSILSLMDHARRPACRGARSRSGEPSFACRFEQ